MSVLERKFSAFNIKVLIIICILTLGEIITRYFFGSSDYCFGSRGPTVVFSVGKTVFYNIGLARTACAEVKEIVIVFIVFIGSRNKGACTCGTLLLLDGRGYHVGTYVTLSGGFHYYIYIRAVIVAFIFKAVCQKGVCYYCFNSLACLRGAVKGKGCKHPYIGGVEKVARIHKISDKLF